MSQRMRYFILLMLINLVVIVIYLIFEHLRRKEKYASIWMKAGMMLLCPVVGPLFLLGSFLLYKLFASQGMDLSDVVFSKERTDTLQRPDEDVEKNMVALEEALEVSDKKSLRTLMMNVIRGDYKHSLSAIALALNSEDSETAHYAASVLQEVLNDFRTGVHERYRLCLVEDEKQAENCIHLIEYMNPIIEQKVLTDLEQHSMAERMDEVLFVRYTNLGSGHFFNKSSQKISSTMYEKICQSLLDVKEYETCGKWCQRSMKQYPRALSSFTCQLKLFYSCNDRDNFFRVMDELKESEIAIDNETLEMIRTFM